MNRRIQYFIILIVLAGVAMAGIIPLVLSLSGNGTPDTSTSDPAIPDTTTPDNSINAVRDADERNLPIPMNYYNTCCADPDDPLHIITQGDWTYPESFPRPHEYLDGNTEPYYLVKWYNTKKNNIFQFAQPDSYVIGGEPTGGLTYGWGLPESYAGNTTRQIVLDRNDHTWGCFGDSCDQSYGTDISVINAPLNFVPVYSTLVGTVVEMLGSDPDIPAVCPNGSSNCHGYGNFVRTRNSKWTSVNAVDLYYDMNECSIDRRFTPPVGVAGGYYDNQGTPAHTWDKNACKFPARFTDDECLMDCITAQLYNYTLGGASWVGESTCKMEYDERTEDLDAYGNSIPGTGDFLECDPCAASGGTKYGDPTGEFQGCNKFLPDGSDPGQPYCMSYYCVTQNNKNRPIVPAYRMITDGMDNTMFRNKRLGEPGPNNTDGYYRDYGDQAPWCGEGKCGVSIYVDIAVVHTTNYEVVQAYLTDGSVDQFIPKTSITPEISIQTARDTTLTNFDQIGTLGNSGYYKAGPVYKLNSKRPMLHYEVWRAAGGGYDPPDTQMIPWPWGPNETPQVTIGNDKHPLVPTMYNNFLFPKVCESGDQLPANVLADIDNFPIGRATCERPNPDDPGNPIINEFEVYALNVTREAWTSEGGTAADGIGYVYKPYTYKNPSTAKDASPDENPQLYWKIVRRTGDNKALLSITMGDPDLYYASHRQMLPNKETGPFVSSAGPLEAERYPIDFNFQIESEAHESCSIQMITENPIADTYGTEPINKQPSTCIGKARVDDHPDQYKLKTGFVDCNCNPNGSCSCGSSDPADACFPPGSGLESLTSLETPTPPAELPPEVRP
ncbi:hypothetical protein AUK40_04280 [Candidatus Wirthbacteria bacterium CG2_30_54_11]|uniref:Uncharacterized protein n=1 Tax=Candidatus Wirthbacteria bacterium CG2_30_54_11 TaxID=1817892 RepID=A0A1J5J0E4_9BACT|nr:MAG: hypothetical protein AUK40_04280 [Candidatus Wirthbacteria bacterium CG2_30_54_11]